MGLVSRVFSEDDLEAMPGFISIGHCRYSTTGSSSMDNIQPIIRQPAGPARPNGCLGLDALWQLVGFHLVWAGHPGRGRALGVGKVKFTGQVLQKAKLVSYQLDIKRVISRKLTMAIADGSLSVDGREIYVAEDLRVGLFQSTDNF